MSETGYWVGPATHPSRYRLTRLLATGGEGEVWQGNDVAQQTVAIKISHVRVGDDRWESRALHLFAVRHRGLVRVRDAFTGPAPHRGDEPGTGERRYVVMTYQPGLTLQEWLEEQSDVGLRKRRALLASLAATLDDLHHGHVGHGPMAHGDVKPGNVIIGPSGAPVLVDLGLLTTLAADATSGHTPLYAAPELRHGNAASPATDRFSYAITAVQVLTGTAPRRTSDGSADLHHLRQLAHRHPALRRTPRLRRQLLRLLADDPAARPTRLTPRRTRATAPLAACLVSVLVVSSASSTVIAPRHQGERASADANPAEVAVDVTRIAPRPRLDPDPPQSQPTRRPAEEPLGPAIDIVFDGDDILSGSYTDDELGCSDEILALPPAATSYREFLEQTGRRSVPDIYVRLQQEGSSWGEGHQFVELTTRGRKTVVIDAVKSQVLGAVAPPRWLLNPVPAGVVCGEEPPPVHDEPPPVRTSGRYALNLRTGGWRPQPTSDQRPLGVLPNEATSLSIKTAACGGNYRFNIVVLFHLLGDTTRYYAKEIGPFQAFGHAAAARYATALYSGNGEFLISHSETVSGAPDYCHDVPGISVAPSFMPRDRELAELMVQLVAHGRRLLPTQTREEVIAWAVDQVGWSGPSFVDVQSWCHLADRGGWRARC